MTVRVSVYHELGACLQRLVGHRVHVADDQVRPVAGVEEGVRAAVHGEQHRAVLTDVGAQGPQVLAVAVAADDHEDVPVLHGGGELRQVDAVGEQVALALEELERVDGERVELGGHAGVRVLDRPGHRGLGQEHALGDDLVVRVVEHVLVEADGGAVGDPGQHLRADVVDDRDPRVEEEPWTQVRVPPGDRLRGVHHGGDPAGDQLVGGHAVQVGVVDDRDVTWLEPAHQDLGLEVDPGHADNAGRRFGPTPPDVRKPDGGYSHRLSSWHTGATAHRQLGQRGA